MATLKESMEGMAGGAAQLPRPTLLQRSSLSSSFQLSAGYCSGELCVMVLDFFLFGAAYMYNTTSCHRVTCLLFVTGLINLVPRVPRARYTVICAFFLSCLCCDSSQGTAARRPRGTILDATQKACTSDGSTRLLLPSSADCVDGCVTLACLSRTTVVLVCISARDGYRWKMV